MKDIVLSKRMETVVDMVSPRSFAVADIGCDHAYVSIALIERKIAERVVAMDVRLGPLEIAKKNVAVYGMEERIELRLSDGLDRLSEGEADSVVIAGMGGLLMQDILERGKKVLDSEEKRPALVLQPQSDIREIRIFIQEHAYHIVQEKMLLDAGKYYTVIKAEPGTEKRKYDEVELQYGRYNLEHRDDILYGYLKKEKNTLESLLMKLTDIVEDSQRTGKMISERTIKRKNFVWKEKEMNQEALKYYVNLEEYI